VARSPATPLSGPPLRIAASRVASLPLRELEGRCLGRLLANGLLRAIAVDPRAGVRALSARLVRERERHRVEVRRLRALYRPQIALAHSAGGEVAGVDEVGMGPLAGPVVAAAVVLPVSPRLWGLADSKQVPDEVRRTLAARIREVARDVSIGTASREEIDRLNVYHAGLLAMRRAIDGLRDRPAHVAIDGRVVPDVAIPQSRWIGGDARVAAIAAASIVAKVHRDDLMRRLDTRHPGFGFAQNVGYGTAEHLAALRRLGPTPEHRRSFAPVREAYGLPLAPASEVARPRRSLSEDRA
jgi:ribonuclease HII